MNLLAIDPGIRGCGAAFFMDSCLVRAAYVENPEVAGNHALAAREMANAVAGWVDCYARVEELALEWPRIYKTRIREGKMREDPNDLLALCGVNSALAAFIPWAVPTCYAPSDWKMQLKKEKCHPRIKATLAHNMLDAVGIGLYHLGRFERKRVIA